MVPWVLASEYSTQHLDWPCPILHILLTMTNNSTFAPPYSLVCTSATVHLKKNASSYIFMNNSVKNQRQFKYYL